MEEQLYKIMGFRLNFKHLCLGKIISSSMKKIILLLVVSCFLFTSGCSENPEYSALFHTVEGTVIDKNGKPLQGVKAYIGNYRLISNADGKFLFNAIQDPYDLQLAYINVAGKPTGVKYTSLMNEKIVLELDDMMGSSPYGANISVSLPAVPVNSRYLIFITDLKNFSFCNPTTTSMPPLFLNWVDSDNVNAKVIVFVQNTENRQYDNFASKDIVMVNNQDINVNFVSDDFNLNPEDIPISGSINNVSGYGTPDSQLGFRFSDGPGLYGDGTVAFTSANNNYSFFIPGNIPVPGKYMVEARSEGATNQFSMNTITYDPKFPNAAINLLTPPKQSEPVNNAAGINYSTYFTYTDGGGDGIYRVSVESSGREFKIYTRATSFQIPQFPNDPEFLIAANESFTWQIVKLIGVNNVDELVRTRSINQKEQTGMTGSELYGFTTQP